MKLFMLMNNVVVHEHVQFHSCSTSKNREICSWNFHLSKKLSIEALWLRPRPEAKCKYWSGSTLAFLARLFEEYGELSQSPLSCRHRWFRLKFCGQGLFSYTMYVIVLKLHTLIPGNHMTLQDKSHNSRLSFGLFIPPLDLEYQVKVLHAQPFLINRTCYGIETSHNDPRSSHDPAGQAP